VNDEILAHWGMYRQKQTAAFTLRNSKKKKKSAGFMTRFEP